MGRQMTKWGRTEGNGGQREAGGTVPHKGMNTIGGRFETFLAPFVSRLIIIKRRNTNQPDAVNQKKAISSRCLSGNQ